MDFMAHDLRYSLFANIHAHCSLSTLPIRPPAAFHPSLGVHPLTQASWLVGKLLCKITADLFIVMAPITNTYDCRVLRMEDAMTNLWLCGLGQNGIL